MTEQIVFIRSVARVGPTHAHLARAADRPSPTDVGCAHRYRVSPGRGARRRRVVYDRSRGHFRATMRRALVNTGSEPITRYLIRIKVDRFPDDPERSYALLP